jgi:hypothetical protein
VPFNLINGDMLMAGLFGGITAAGTMKLAQHGVDKDPVTADVLLDEMEQQSLGPGEIAGIATGPKSRVATERRA